MIHRRLLSSFLSAALATGVAHAADDPRATLLVDAKALAAHIDDADLVLLHVGDADEYAKGHIPGARLVTLDDISVSEHTATGLMLEMPGDEDLRARLQKLGISDASHVVVYYGKDWVSPSTRVVFTLQYAGLGERTQLLDGGMGAWVRAGGALSAKAPTIAAGTLSPLRTQDLIVDAAKVRAQLHTPGVAIVDGRAAAYYDGVETGGAHGFTHRTGHIEGAHSIPFTEITDERMQLRPDAELRALFTKAGVKPGDTVVGYCHIGQQATAMLFAARLLGHPVKLYDGAFEDWSRGKENPVEASPASGQP
ncbi:MAG: rhodanese-like domain-containing protein [Tahibacter sp.]